MALARERRRFVYRPLLIFLRREGFVVNHKRPFRLHHEERLMMRRRRGRKRALGTRTPMPVPARRNGLWVLDFVADQLVSGRRFRILAIFDVCTRGCLAAMADVSLSASGWRELDRLVAVHGEPTAIGSDTELTSNAILTWTGRLAIHRPRQAGAERLHRELQWPPARRGPERDVVHLAAPGPCSAQGMAARLQHRAA